jgi:hypothetical protein
MFLFSTKDPTCSSPLEMESCAQKIALHLVSESFALSMTTQVLSVEKSIEINAINTPSQKEMRI